MLMLSTPAMSPWWFVVPMLAIALVAWNERVPLKSIGRVLVAVLIAGVLLSGATTNFLIDCGRRWWAIECW